MILESETDAGRARVLFLVVRRSLFPDGIRRVLRGLAAGKKGPRLINRAGLRSQPTRRIDDSQARTKNKMRPLPFSSKLTEWRASCRELINRAAKRKKKGDARKQEKDIVGPWGISGLLVPLLSISFVFAPFLRTSNHPKDRGPSTMVLFPWATFESMLARLL